MDVVQLVKDGKAIFEWAEIKTTHEDKTLILDVFRDAMKFDGVEACTWDFKPLPANDPNHGKVYDGVRLPASAKQLQEIADLLSCMLLTPRIVDQIWLQASLKFDSIVNVKGNIVAISNINDVHEAIEAKIESLGGDPGDATLISCVGKYWVLVNELAQSKFGEQGACNYGWCAKTASGPGVTYPVQCWQRPGLAHDFHHWDPSQTIRLMYRFATLIQEGHAPREIDLHEIATDPELAPLISHQGVLKYLRLPGVPEPEPTKEGGIITLPEITIYGKPPKAVS
jgi:hypothetical protein